MLQHSIIDKLQQLKFYGMCHALEDQLQQSDINELQFEERLNLLLDREITELGTDAGRGQLEHRERIRAHIAEHWSSTD